MMYAKTFFVPVLGVVILFKCPRGGGPSFYECIPERLRLYALFFVGISTLIFMWAIVYAEDKMPHVQGKIGVDEDCLRFKVRKQGRLESIEIDWPSVTVIENDETGLSVSTRYGEFRFRAEGFSSSDIYDCFRQEFAAKRYEK